MKEFLIKYYFTILVIILFLQTLFWYNISILTLGGILLMIGSYFILVGNIFKSVIIYTLADVCWIINAYVSSDWFGVLTISLGIISGLIVTYKMKQGIFLKSLKVTNGSN